MAFPPELIGTLRLVMGFVQRTRSFARGVKDRGSHSTLISRALRSDVYDGKFVCVCSVNSPELTPLPPFESIV